MMSSENHFLTALKREHIDRTNGNLLMQNSRPNERPQQYLTLNFEFGKFISLIQGYYLLINSKLLSAKHICLNRMFIFFKENQPVLITWLTDKS